MKSGDAQSVLFTQYAQSCIKFKARQLSRRSEFSRSDEGDLENDLWVALLGKAGSFDPERSSPNTFTDRVVSTSAGMIVRGPYRQKRAPGRGAISLDCTKDAVNDDGKKPLAECISEADLSRRTGVARQDEIAARVDAAALDHAFSMMPEEARDACRLVMGGSITSAARDMGTTRHRIRELLQIARPYLERSGFTNG
jgi:hypothetical protein